MKVKRERNPFPGPSPNFKPSFVGGKLTFLKLGSVLVDLSACGCARFFLKANKAKIGAFEVECVFWPADLI